MCVYVHGVVIHKEDHVFETNLSNYIDFVFSAFGCPHQKNEREISSRC